MIERRRYMGLTALPYDYEVEYLESSGTQYIDTGILPQEYTPNIEISYRKLTNSLFTPYAAANSWAWQIESISDNSSRLYWMGDNSVKYTELKTNSDYIMTLYNNTITIVENGVQVASTSAQRRTCSHSICFFGQLHPGKARIYYLKVLNGNQPVFDAIPVRVGTIGYMYDKVSGQLFGNAGTGAFILGPDK